MVPTLDGLIKHLKREDKPVHVRSNISVHSFAFAILKRLYIKDSAENTIKHLIVFSGIYGLIITCFFEKRKGTNNGTQSRLTCAWKKYYFSPDHS